MGLKSKMKGKSGEREVADLFRGLLGDFEHVGRNHQQAEKGGSDLVGIPHLSVEVKRYRVIPWGKGLTDWWIQCVEQADFEGKKPCLVFRQDRGKWFVMLSAYPEALKHWTPSYPVIMLWEQFEHWFRATMANRPVEFMK